MTDIIREFGDPNADFDVNFDQSTKTGVSIGTGNDSFVFSIPSNVDFALPSVAIQNAQADLEGVSFTYEIGSGQITVKTRNSSGGAVTADLVLRYFYLK